jgi:carbonic anhydrase
MNDLNQLFENNRAWAREITARDADFFRKLARQQSPEFLWIGCSDSRVPANVIVGLLPGELFVHRNVANLVVHSDLNCLSVMQFAVDVLKVKQIIVCGHYGCSGVQATLSERKIGLSDNWLRHVQDVRLKYDERLKSLPMAARLDRLCELNVIEQVVNVSQTTVVSEARDRGQNVTVHGVVYGLRDGLLHDLNVTVKKEAELAEAYQAAITKLDWSGK